MTGKCQDKVDGGQQADHNSGNLWLLDDKERHLEESVCPKITMAQSMTTTTIMITWSVMHYSLSISKYII